MYREKHCKEIHPCNLKNIKYCIFEKKIDSNKFLRNIYCYSNINSWWMHVYTYA